jgi:predicted metal-dependent hydrolase
MADPNIRVLHQRRASLMMRATRTGIEVYVPLWLPKDSRAVRAFIAEGLKQLADKVPPTPPEQTSPAALRALVDTWAARIGVQPGRVTLRAMQRKWGSCSQRGHITLNTALCWLPPHLAEYVVVHELAHLRVFNHGKDFKALLRQHLPDWEAYARELRAWHL